MGKVHRTSLRYVIGGVILVAALASATIALLWSRTHHALPAEAENSLQLLNLPPNRWVKYHEERPGTWSRQGHAGMAFDTKRRTLLIFGSDTHGENWDNSVHEFHILSKRWETHQAAAGPETYRVDASGIPVAGTTSLMPWAMHTYDAIQYHPTLDALVVMSTTEHNPGGPVRSISRQPTWIYDLSARQWKPFENGGRPAPSIFGGSSAYDERRGVIVACRSGIFELDVVSGTWRKASSEHHCDLHNTMAYDERRGEFFIFGDYSPTNLIWSYLPGETPGDPGTWTLHRPRGDPCPPYSSVPVVYDSAQDVFVLVVDNLAAGPPPRPQATSASTYLYDPEAGTYTKLPGADLAQIGMNYMMAWDRNHDVAFLVTGDSHGTVTVWAMKPLSKTPVRLHKN